MASIELNNDNVINVGIKNPNKVSVNVSNPSKIETTTKNLEYIPDYKKYEEERQKNEIERETFINNFKADVELGKFKGEPGPPGTTLYAELTDKPKINNVELIDNKTSDDLGLQETLDSGVNIKTINNKSILGEGNIEIADMEALTNLELEELLNRDI
nr:MAG TPA: hypothetical protein [Bacteriophage sp.]